MYDGPPAHGGEDFGGLGLGTVRQVYERRARAINAGDWWRRHRSASEHDRTSACSARARCPAATDPTRSNQDVGRTVDLHRRGALKVRCRWDSAGTVWAGSDGEPAPPGASSAGRARAAITPLPPQSTCATSASTDTPYPSASASRLPGIASSTSPTPGRGGAARVLVALPHHPKRDDLPPRRVAGGTPAVQDPRAPTRSFCSVEPVSPRQRLSWRRVELSPAANSPPLPGTAAPAGTPETPACTQIPSRSDASDTLLDHTDAEIAALLNESGLRTGHGVIFRPRRVQAICREYRLSSRYERLP